jgi:hypothetical protein
VNVGDLVKYAGGDRFSDSVKEGHLVTFPDISAVALWRRGIYAFLIADGPLGMILPAEMAKLVASGLLTSNGEITALGHAIGEPETSLKREAA